MIQVAHALHDIARLRVHCTPCRATCVPTQPLTRAFPPFPLQFNFRFPFRTAAQVAAGVTSGPNSALQRAGGSYQVRWGGAPKSRLTCTSRLTLSFSRCPAVDIPRRGHAHWPGERAWRTVHIPPCGGACHALSPLDALCREPCDLREQAPARWTQGL